MVDRNKNHVIERKIICKNEKYNKLKIINVKEK